MSPPLHFHHHHEEKLKCPYRGCGKSFEKPAVLTDNSTIPRQTYYACPYCMSKIDIVVENMKIIGVKTTDYPKVFDSPAKCAYYFGFLNTIPKEMPIPDECLVCPKILQCSVKKR
jgi:DNA-directed RNA polymerase subunit RPC12/RpoP